MKMIRHTTVKPRVNKPRLKPKIKRIEVNRMSVVVERPTPSIVAPMASMKHKPTSFSEMIFDSKKRQETYDYYDKIYEETEDEKEIFRIMSSRRRNK